MATTIKLDRGQRDAIYGELLLDLSGTGDIRLNLDNADFDAARRLRRRYEEDMRSSTISAGSPARTATTSRASCNGWIARRARRCTSTSSSRGGEFATRAASTQAAGGDAFAQMAGVEDDDAVDGGGTTEEDG
jgi:hypothetical protein